MVDEELRRAGQRVQTALELADLAEEMVDARIRREHPELDQRDVRQLVAAWYAHRPGAEHGDGDGDPIPWPRR